MKLLGVSGSLRAASFNTALLRAAQECAPEGVTIEIFGLHDLPLFNQDVEDQGDPAPVIAWKEAIRSSDALLLACPEYNGGVTGVLKNAIDWASRGAPSVLQGKTACILGASPGVTGTVRAQDALRQSLRKVSAEYWPLSEMLVGQAHTKIENGQVIDEKTLAYLGRHLTAFIEHLRVEGK
ncbi:MAG: NAD(P)H-dependent oxidoreductase [Caulobacter sp.]|nr:NAD(P)H-dependent oxidoreductase [Caulobacter sp.]